jgi:hypothetical protein
MKNAALLVTVLAACTTEGIEEQDTPTAPVASSATTQVAGHDVIIATGGAATIRIHDTTAIGIEGNASAGFSVSPFETDQWPNTISPEYWVRAHAAGTGLYEIITSKGIATNLVHSAAVADVQLRPAQYELDGTSPFALAPNRTDVEIAIFDARGKRLVDATLSVAGSQTAWDRATLAATSGRQSVVVEADSFVSKKFYVDVVDAIDRVERIRANDRTCFHAYAGSTEVAVAMTFDGGTADPNATNCAIAPASADPTMRIVR